MKVSKQATKTTAIQLLKYGVIGASNTIITAITFYVLNTILSVPYVPANAAGYILGVVNSFVWNRTWVFKTKQNLKREALLFVIGFLVCYGLQMAVSGRMRTENLHTGVDSQCRTKHRDAHLNGGVHHSQLHLQSHHHISSKKIGFTPTVAILPEHW